MRYRELREQTRGTLTNFGASEGAIPIVSTTTCDPPGESRATPTPPRLVVVIVHRGNRPGPTRRRASSSAPRLRPRICPADSERCRHKTPCLMRVDQSRGVQDATYNKSRCGGKREKKTPRENPSSAVRGARVSTRDSTSRRNDFEEKKNYPVYYMFCAAFTRRMSG